MNVQNIPIGELNPYKNNPRKNDGAVDAVAASKAFGFKIPIVVDKDRTIICGHTRVKAAEKLGLSSVPAVVADDLNSAQIKAFRLADNKVAEIAEWDEDLLKVELDGLADVLDLDMGEFGFSFDDGPKPTEDVVEDDFDIAPPAEPRSQLGDIYQLCDHYVMCGDSTKLADVQRLMNGTQVDLLLTDPPYNVDYEGTAGKIKNDSMPDEKFRAFLTDAFSAADSVMKPGAAYYIWHADSEGYNFRTAARETGWKLRQCLVWVKSSIVLGRQDYQWKHEPCLYGWKDGASHHWYGGRRERTTVTAYDIMELSNKNKKELLQWIEEYLANGDEVDTSILYEKKPNVSHEHPTMKPVKLLARQVRNSTKEGDLVLDLFGGSGSTLMACEQLGRKCYMMEYDPRFVDVIVDRWEAFTGKCAKKIN